MVEGVCLPPVLMAAMRLTKIYMGIRPISVCFCCSYPCKTVNWGVSFGCFGYKTTVKTGLIWRSKNSLQPFIYRRFRWFEVQNPWPVDSRNVWRAWNREIYVWRMKITLPNLELRFLCIYKHHNQQMCSQNKIHKHK